MVSIYTVNLVKGSLIEYMKSRIVDKNSISPQLYVDIRDTYTSMFKNSFGDVITKNVEEKVLIASYMLKFLITTFIDNNPDYEIDDLRNLLRRFISIQINDIHLWCCEIGHILHD